jgi:flagellar biosynthetic protein FlhB
MSENSTPEQRTEMPTSRRIGQLRKDGKMFFSSELVLVVSLSSAFITLSMMWQPLFRDMGLLFVKSFQLLKRTEPLTVHDLHAGFIGLLFLLGPYILILVGIVAATTSLTVMLQTDWNVKEKKIKFEFNKLNPIGGIKRVFSIGGLFTTLKALFKLCLILPIAYFALKRFAPHMVELMHTSIEAVLVYTGTSMAYLFWKILYLLIALAIFDYFWGKHQWLKNVKMTKEEVKDERKSMEGDEVTKRKIQTKALQRVWQRLQDSIPKADVVITNPTHYAVALKYDRSSMRAPQVLAKGRGHMALHIRRLATEANVPIVERKPLARALYASCEVGAEIPYDLYRAVAEVLAYVYRLKNPYAYQRQQMAERAKTATTAGRS